jgi:hypothetical protein
MQVTAAGLPQTSWNKVWCVRCNNEAGAFCARDHGHNVEDREVSFVGPGTAAGRMHWTWGMMHKYEDALAELTDYNPVMSNERGLTEAKFIETFDKLWKFYLERKEDG